MEPQVGLIDYLFVLLILIAGFLSIRALIGNISFLREELRIPRALTSDQMPGKTKSFILMSLWGVLTAMFAGSSLVLLANPSRIIAGRYTPDMYGWLAGLVMIVAAAACGLLVFRYFLFWIRFRQ